MLWGCSLLSTHPHNKQSRPTNNIARTNVDKNTYSVKTKNGMPRAVRIASTSAQMTRVEKTIGLNMTGNHPLSNRELCQNSPAKRKALLPGERHRISAVAVHGSRRGECFFTACTF